ncbi:MAG: FtsX-like permease family protein [Limisphaerales bacterium]
MKFLRAIWRSLLAMAQRRSVKKEIHEELLFHIEQRTAENIAAVFAGVSLLLCAIGIYGVLAYSVLRRVREIGIRMALGAQRGDVLTMVMFERGRLVLIGVGLGLMAAFWLTRLLQSQLFEVSPTDPLVMTVVVLVLLAVALLACYLPARRATKIDPMTALRYE